jgi:hypothetical protein
MRLLSNPQLLVSGALANAGGASNLTLVLRISAYFLRRFLKSANPIRPQSARLDAAATPTRPSSDLRPGAARPIVQRLS